MLDKALCCNFVVIAVVFGADAFLDCWLLVLIRVVFWLFNVCFWLLVVAVRGRAFCVVADVASIFEGVFKRTVSTRSWFS